MTEYKSDTTNIFNIYYTEDLPEEITKQLPKDCWQEQIIKLFVLAGKPLSIDEVLVGCYRKYKTIYDKQTLANYVWQLTKRHGCVLEKVKGRKGVYQYKKGFQRFEVQDE